MKCERALKILLNVKSGFDIKLNQEEIEELIQLGFVSLFELPVGNIDLDEELSNLKNKYVQTSAELRKLSKEIIGIKGDYNQLFKYKKLFGLLSLRKIIKLKFHLKELKGKSLEKEDQLYFFKNRILNLNAEKKAFKNAIKVNGKRISLTPLGDTYIDEIKARKRFFSKDLIEIVNLIEKLDDQYSRLLNQLENLMKRNYFTPIWGLFFMNMGMVKLGSIMNSITNKYYWPKAQKKMMKLSISQLIDPTTINTRSATITLNEYSSHNPSEKLNRMFYKNNLNTYLKPFNEIIEFMGNLFVASFLDFDPAENETNKFLEQLDNHLKNQIIKTKNKKYTTASLLILALSPNPEKYQYFNTLFTEAPNGKEIFSAIATLFPWDVEETWMVLLRAESVILRAQSAKFIPELLVYALLLTMNPSILNIEENLEMEDLKRWRYLIIPTIHLLNYGLMEEGLETYVKSRPLAYIISPRYRVYSSLHYHRIG